MAYELDLRVSASTGDAVNNLERVQDSVRNVSSATTQAGNTISQSMNQATTATQNYGKAVQDVGKVAQNVNTQGIVQGINAITSAIQGDGGAESIIKGFAGTVGGLVSTLNPAVGALITAGGALVAAGIGKITKETDEAEDNKVAEYIETLKTKIYDFSGTAKTIVENSYLSGLGTEFVSFYSQIEDITGTNFETVKTNTETLYSGAKKYWYALQGKDENGKLLSSMTKEERDAYLEPILGEGGLKDTLDSIGIHLFKSDGKGGYDLQYDEETLYAEVESVFLTLDGLYGITQLFKKKEDGSGYEYEGSWQDAKDYLEENAIQLKDYIISSGYNIFDSKNKLITDWDAFKLKIAGLNDDAWKKLIGSFSIGVISKDESGNVVIPDWEAFMTELNTNLQSEEFRALLTSQGIDVFKDADGNWRISDQFLNAEQELTTKMNEDMAAFLHSFGIDFFKKSDGTWYLDGDWPEVKSKLEELAKDEAFVETLKSFGVDIFEKDGDTYKIVSDYDAVMAQLQALGENTDLTTIAEALGLEASDYLAMIHRINLINDHLKGTGITLAELTADKHTIEVSAELALSKDIADLATQTLSQVQAVYSGFVESEIIQNDSITGMSYWLTKFFRGECTAEELANNYAYYYTQKNKAQKLGEQIAEKGVEREEALDELGAFYENRPFWQEASEKWIPDGTWEKAFELYGDDDESVMKYVHGVYKENGYGQEGYQELSRGSWLELIGIMRELMISEEEKGWIDELKLIEEDMAKREEEAKANDTKKEGENPEIQTENTSIITGEGSSVIIEGGTTPDNGFNSSLELNNGSGGGGGNPYAQYNGNVDQSTYSNSTIIQGDQNNTYNYYEPSYSTEQD